MKTVLPTNKFFVQSFYFLKTEFERMSLSISNSYPLTNHPLFSRFIREVTEDNEILAVYHYGSSVTRDDFRDIDLCIISYDDEPSAFFDRFLHYSGSYAAMGLVPLDITLFSLLPLYIKIQIIREGIPVFVRDNDFLFEKIQKTSREWDDYEPSYRIMIERRK